jgi:cytochrome P450
MSSSIAPFGMPEAYPAPAVRLIAGALLRKLQVPQLVADHRACDHVPARTGGPAMTTDVQPVMFNPFDPEFRKNPYPTYQRLLEEDPVQESPLGGLVLSRYADCVSLLRDPRGSSDFRKSDAFREQALAQGLDYEALLMENRSFLFLDPPDHTRLRGLVNKAFTPRVVESLRPRIEAIVTDLLDAALKRGEMDVMEDFAYPLPVTIICDMLGVPVEDNVRFRAWTKEAARSLDPEDLLTPAESAKRQETFDAFHAYFEDLIAKRRAAPQDDLISALIAVEDEGTRLSHDELISTCILLLIAGHETTVNLIGNGTLQLLRHPDQLRLLRDRPGLLKTAVEELLRFDPPVQLTGRMALEDIPFGDKVLKKGQQAVILVGAANRDPVQFPDPQRLDITREDNRHIAFGMGIHFCLGAPLARVEGQIALGQLVRRTSELAMTVEEPPYKENLVLRGLESLPVKLR